MELSSELLSQFAKVTNDQRQTKKETAVYGTIVEWNDGLYVQLDGSDICTPYDATTAVEPGDRVAIQIKNHTATVTGNMSSPAARVGSVEEINGKVSVYIDEIQAHKAIIDNLDVKYAQIKDLDAANAEIVNLKADKAEVKDLQAINASIDNLQAETAKITELEADFGDFKVLSVDELAAKYAFIKELDANEIDTESLNAKYANIDFANIEDAAITNFLAKSGMIEGLIVDGAYVTKELVGVTISGDLIKANTIQADKLVVKGEDGLYYALNYESGKFKQGDVVPTEGLHGSIIVAKSITAEQIQVSDLKAFGATIGGFKITDKAIHSAVKDGPNNTTRGIYLDNEGQFAVGDTNQFVKYYKQADGTYKFEILADTILLKSEDKNVDISEFGTRIDDAETAIEQNQKDIALKASETYVNDAVDNITVGGRNLIPDSDEEILFKDTYYLFNLTEYGVENIQNKKVTVSFDAYTDEPGADIDYYLRCVNSETNAVVSVDRHYIYDLTDTYKRYSGTLDTSLAAGNTITAFAIRSTADTPTVYVRNVKVEIGDKATDWTPAPEDQYTKKQADAAIKVAAKAITSEVSGTYATKGEVTEAETRVEQKVDSLATTVSKDYATKSALKEAESAIEQTANSISSSVKATFDALELGGRNLLPDSGDEISFKNKVQTFNLTDYGVENVKNKNVTISFDAYTDEPGVGIDYYMRYIDPATNSGKAVGRVIVNSLTDTYQKYSATINTAEAGDNDITMFAIRSTKNSTVPTSSETATIYVKNIKVEIGDKATDWTPAPEDMASADALKDAAEDAKSANSLALQLSNSFNNLVSSDKGGSFFQQDDEGNWYFTSAETKAEMVAISNALAALDAATGEDLDIIKRELAALTKLSNYIRLETGGEHPSIELGENDSPYKTVITNTDIKYYNGSIVLATFDGNGLTADNVTVNKQLNVAGLVTRKKNNGYVGMGLF